MKSHTEPSRGAKNGGLVCWLTFAGVVIGFMAGQSWAGDPVKIGSLHADPRAYNLKLVNVDGVVVAHRMNHFIGSMSKLEKCIQNFALKDDTGTIDAVYATLCQKGGIILENGDHVTVEAHYSGVLEVRSVTKH